MAVAVGNDGWGLTLELSVPPRECSALRMYFDIGPRSTAPDNVVYPDTAVLQFLTPEDPQRQWMVRPLSRRGRCRC